MSITGTLRWQLLKDTAQVPQNTSTRAAPGARYGFYVGGIIYASDWNSVVSTAERAARYCSCHCNYCTCDCNYCTCNCNHCRCNCNHCTCDCAHGCVCNCNYS